MIGAFGYGFIFSSGTSAAPLLVLLTVAAAQANAANGLLLALAFGIGRGLPFLLVGLFAGVVVRFTWGRSLAPRNSVHERYGPFGCERVLHAGVHHASVTSQRMELGHGD